MATVTKTSPTPPLPAERVRLELPPPTFAAYKALADARGVDVEDYLNEHLRQTTSHDHSGAGLYFSAPQAKRLCALTGRGTSTDPEVLIQRLSPLQKISVEGVEIDLDTQVVERLLHLGRGRGRTPEEFIAREARNGIRVSLGLSPK